MFPERYEVHSILAEGGMGRIYLGIDTRLHREIAIKTILPEQTSSMVAERFYREAQAIAMLDHPSIVRVYDYSGPNSPLHFIVMERLKGVDLQTLIDQTPVSESVAMAIAYQIGHALSHLHTAGLIHRDIKPSNIMIEPNGRVVLVDFGLVKGTLAVGERETFVASNTRIVGTAVFMSPEQIRGTPLDGRTDLFSLGGTLYVALSQVFPFDGSSLSEVSRNILDGRRHRIDALVDLGDDNAAIIEKLLAGRPGDRFQTGDELCAALGPQLQRLGIFSPQQTVADWVKTLDFDALVKRPTAAQPSGEKIEVTKVVTRVQTRTQPTPPKKPFPYKMVAVAAALLLAAIALALLLPSKNAKTRAATETAQVQALPPPTETEEVKPLEPAPAEVQALPPPTETEQVKPLEPLPPQEEPKKKETVSKVSFDIQPWGDVTVDGKVLGTTPQLRFARLPYGTHTVVVYHPKLGTKKIALVVNKPEQTLEVILAR